MKKVIILLIAALILINFVSAEKSLYYKANMFFYEDKFFIDSVDLVLKENVTPEITNDMIVEISNDVEIPIYYDSFNADEKIISEYDGIDPEYKNTYETYLFLDEISVYFPYSKDTKSIRIYNNFGEIYLDENINDYINPDDVIKIDEDKKFFLFTLSPFNLIKPAFLILFICYTLFVIMFIYNNKNTKKRK